MTTKKEQPHPPVPAHGREQKKRETLERIARCGLQLFAKKGYDATTLEDIAAAAGISRRTFFYYFDSKDAVLGHWQGGQFIDELGPTIRDGSLAHGPYKLVRDSLLKLAATYETKESLTVDRIMRKSETLKTRKQIIFAGMEETIYAALCARTQKASGKSTARPQLRTVAMAGIGTLRIAMDAWREQRGKRSLAAFLKDAFAALERLG